MAHQRAISKSKNLLIRKRLIKMNKKMNVLKVGLALAAAVMVTGCASIGSVNTKMVNNSNEGIFYGGTGTPDSKQVKEICDAINNKDSRCNNQQNYVVTAAYSKFGFADGAVGMNVLVNKNFKDLDKLNFNGRYGDKNMPFVKVKVIPGQLGEILEVVSTNGDGKCYWSGMPRAGGVVCPAYNYDYRKDFTGVVFR